MIYKINPSGYKRVENINFHGAELLSCYNNNYFYNQETDDLILEECDDDNGFTYYRIEIIDGEVDETRLGLIIDNDYNGIFADDFFDKNENGEVELESESC